MKTLKNIVEEILSDLEKLDNLNLVMENIPKNLPLSRFKIALEVMKILRNKKNLVKCKCGNKIEDLGMCEECLRKWTNNMDDSKFPSDGFGESVYMDLDKENNKFSELKKDYNIKPIKKTNKNQFQILKYINNYIYTHNFCWESDRFDKREKGIIKDIIIMKFNKTINYKSFNVKLIINNKYNPNSKVDILIKTTKEYQKISFDTLRQLLYRLKDY